jgi:D-alanine-D-alanine ligase
MAELLAVGVLMGGTSTEHDISMESGSMILKQLDSKRFRGFPILISTRNQWTWPKNLSESQAGYSKAELKDKLENSGNDWFKAEFPCFPQFPECDIFFIGLHGEGGEDGKLQGFLDLCGMPYTGSGCLGSALAMDKIKSKEIFLKSGVPTPRYRVIDARADLRMEAQNLETEFGLPLVLKHPQGGSSLAMAIPQAPEELEPNLKDLSRDTDFILVEEYIRGREGTCGYIENFMPLSTTEIIPMQDGFFNYEAKYNSERTQEITPGNFTPKLTKEMQRLAEECHKLLGLSVYSRTDFIIKDEELYVLEVNSLPGFTSASLLPQEAEAAGLNYRDLLTKIIEESLRK